MYRKKKAFNYPQIRRFRTQDTALRDVPLFDATKNIERRTPEMKKWKESRGEQDGAVGKEKSEVDEWITSEDRRGAVVRSRGG